MSNQTDGGINKSAAIREIYQRNPKMKVREVIDTLAAKGITVGRSLVHLVKGRIDGAKSHRRMVNRNIPKVDSVSVNTNTVATIRKVKALATEVGGIRTLKAIIDELTA